MDTMPKQNVCPRLLVVGAREGSLGMEIADQALADWEYDRIFTAGIATEALHLDVTNTQSIKDALHEARPDVVVCTVGINEPSSYTYGNSALNYMDHFRTNVIGPMELLRQFAGLSRVAEDAGSWGVVRKFVAISSNSARIARTQSGPYCASKAALSMALRVAAREAASAPQVGPWVWGYEPGLLAGTPMTRATEGRFSATSGDLKFDLALHRMRGVVPEGLSVKSLATRILCDLAFAGPGHNGVMFPFDAGEQ